MPVNDLALWQLSQENKQLPCSLIQTTPGTELLLRDGNQHVSSLEVVSSRTSRKSFNKSVELDRENCNLGREKKRGGEITRKRRKALVLSLSHPSFLKCLLFDC